MARIHPPLELFRPTRVGEWGEHKVLKHLEAGLPQDFDVFHSVNWSNVHQGNQWFGEIDAVVVAPDGHLVLLEVKTGAVSEAGGRLTKRYGDTVKDVDRQTRLQHASMRDALNKAGLGKCRVSQFLVFLDARIREGSASHPRDRIVDAGQIDALCPKILEAVGPQAPVSGVGAGLHARLCRFLEDRFDLAPDPTAHLGQLAGAVQVLSEGLATWVPRIQSASGIYQVHATAGAGKTQLALRLLRDAADAGLRACYVCFNRPLADHIARIAPEGCEVATFHELARTHWQHSHGAAPDFREAGIFDRMAQAFDRHCHASPATLDLLVIDESQDFEPTWVEALSHKLKADGRFYLMGDAGQDVYGREPFELAGATTIVADENFRSPRALVQTLNLLGLADTPIKARCPLEGDVPQFRTYEPESDPGGVQAVSGVVAGLLREGFTASQIALVTLAGQDRSRLLQEEAIAGLPLRKFTGQFDAHGHPIWTQGVLTAESVMRFKGQAAPAVVLCEMDFDALTDARRRRLFVGFTRAQVRLACVLTPRTEAALSAGMVDT